MEGLEYHWLPRPCSEDEISANHRDQSDKPEAYRIEPMNAGVELATFLHQTVLKAWKIEQGVPWALASGAVTGFSGITGIRGWGREG